MNLEPNPLGTQRLTRDLLAMSRWYPAFRLVSDDSATLWTGALKPFRTRMQTYRVVLEYRPEPLGIPVVWVVEPEVSRRTHFFHPHLNSDGSICSYFVPDNTFNPEIDTLPCLVDLVLDWTRRHVFWEERGWWPGPEAPHDPEGVISELRLVPNAACVCGSGRRFRDCHEPHYAAGAAAQRAGRLKPQRDSILYRRTMATLLTELQLRLGSYHAAHLLPDLGPPARYLRPMAT